MKALIMNFRQGKHTQNNNHMVVQVDGYDDQKKAESLINKEVIWRTPSGKEMKGIIIRKHGNKGCVRAKFVPGLPGQAVGTVAEVK